MLRSIRGQETGNKEQDTRRQRGGTALEFGLIMIGFMMMASGLLEFGRGIWVYNTLAYAAREGTRYAVVRGGDSPRPATATEIRDVVRDHARGLDPQKVSVTTTWTPDNKPGSVVQIQVQYNFKPVVPLLPSQTLPLKGTSRMVISY